MNPDNSRSVYKYLELADRFVRVRVLDAAGAGLAVEQGMNRAAYRRAVIGACLEEFRTDLAAKLRGLDSEAPESAAEALYQLCVGVNPELEIHAVSPAAEERREPAPARPEARAKVCSTAEFTRRLRRGVRSLETRLAARVTGQDAAVQAVAQALRRAAAGLARGDRPLGSLLFVGRTGTGKTELARALARELHGDEDGLLRIDCSEYALPHEYSKLIGAPPGYVGFEDGGVLTGALQRRPERVVLFDEIEKAHPRVHNLLLQVLEDGHLSDGHGHRAGFERTLLILTSNAGAAEAAAAGERLGFDPSPPGGRQLAEIAERALRRTFSPEFLGRIDETVLFRDLGPADARRIAATQLTELATRVRRRGPRVEFSRAVAAWVAERGFSLESGAREIRRVIRREIEAPLADALLGGARSSRRRVTVSIRRGRPVFVG